jgi:hypothetical protein
MKRGPKIETLPMSPLEAFMNADNVCHIARSLGVGTESVYRWRKKGIPVYRADQIACKTLGVHPGFIWRKEWVPR